jgi:hypothetical protein
LDGSTSASTTHLMTIDWRYTAPSICAGLPPSYGGACPSSVTVSQAGMHGPPPGSGRQQVCMPCLDLHSRGRPEPGSGDLRLRPIHTLPWPCSLILYVILFRLTNSIFLLQYFQPSEREDGCHACCIAVVLLVAFRFRDDGRSASCPLY